ncbi:SAM-dependent methyltransferase [Vibrio caribbeanicus]|uniref:Cyclopropane-fatty-acyl-phospholipid synthase n=1 Tax=Vibrio caribbeanicus ATCC BAA-2122 TaxID=796620 RepID=E3BEH0_9VIBR|nr:cyclopropane-fatty-acyl-phospholipid synthase family protein [Vibrio caribbeanicus]EFP98587.1 cyclopropane-fatty-acyl-phospholipid synthase [Vibrio caribbeanicus ATCC BAA-2122]
MIDSQTLTLSKQLTVLQKAARELAFSCLNKLSVGSLKVVESFEVMAPQTHQFWGTHSREGLEATIEIKHPGFYSRLLKGGSIAAGEAYMDGWWESPNLTALMELMARNMAALDSIESRSGILSRYSNRFTHWLKRNTLVNSARNIQAHYDLSNALYQTFLDDRMLYSSGIFENSDDTLEQAQINKMERLCQQLKLTSNDRVIEIGTGWGAMAVYMAENYGCHVTTTTISEEQHQHTEELIKKKGLEGRITLLKQDYRLLKGEFDKLVSIEMIEAVGKQFLTSYVEKCQSLLKSGGLMAIQAITIADQRYEYYSNNVDFIQKYIFPGGFLPSITALTQTATNHSDLVLRDLYDIGQDYADTLRQWYLRFNHALETVESIGFDERFTRMWNYYFCYCEGGFRARTISTVHMTFQRP